MTEQEIRVRTADGEMTAFVAHPDEDGPYPVAILYDEAAAERHFARTLELWRRNLAPERVGA